MARRRSRGSSRGRASLVVAKRWTGEGTTVEATTLAGTTSAAAIVSPTDYEQSPTLEQGGVTLVRMRGTISLRATVLGGICFFGIYVVSELSPANPPSSLAGLLDGDCLIHRSLMIGTTEPRVIEIDIKAKRRLTDDQVVLVVEAIGQTVISQFSIRALLLGG